METTQKNSEPGMHPTVQIVQKITLDPVEPWEKTLQDDNNLQYKYMVCDGDSTTYSVWDVYNCCEDCNKWKQMDKKSNLYKKWLDSEAHEKWK